MLFNAQLLSLGSLCFLLFSITVSGVGTPVSSVSDHRPRRRLVRRNSPLEIAKQWSDKILEKKFKEFSVEGHAALYRAATGLFIYHEATYKREWELYEREQQKNPTSPKVAKHWKFWKAHQFTAAEFEKDMKFHEKMIEVIPQILAAEQSKDAAELSTLLASYYEAYSEQLHSLYQRRLPMYDANDLQEVLNKRANEYFLALIQKKIRHSQEIRYSCSEKEDGGD